MTAIAYTVIVTIADEARAKEWLGWLRDGHIADVMAGGAVRAEIVRLDGNDDSPNACVRTYEIRYRFDNRGKFEEYLETHAPRLREDGLKRFPPEAGFTYRRTTGEILHSL